MATTSRGSDTRRHRAWMLLLALALAGGLASCESEPTEPQEVPEGEGEDATTLFGGLTVSEPVGSPSGNAALAAADGGIAYVSASPGTFPDAEEVTITNLANEASQTVAVEDGGFDPVGIEAEPDDELELRVRHRNGTTSTYYTRVPPRKRPRVVRTVPPRDATDVVLSVTLMVVFSEPVDESTVTAETLQLLHDGEPQAGTLELSEDGLRAELKPAQPLEHSTSYTLAVTTAVLDLQGDALEADVQMTFVTQAPIVSVRTGYEQSCALSAAGTAYCWGQNWSGNLGRPASDDPQVPLPMSTNLSFASLSPGLFHTCGVTVEGEAYCWGSNEFRQLGHGPTTSTHQFIPVTGGHHFVSLAVGWMHTCGLTADGSAYCWGSNQAGELGTIEETAETCTASVFDEWYPCSTTPLPVAGGHRFVQLTAGWMHTCGLTDDGAAYCWGWNSGRQLGAISSEICVREEQQQECSRTPLPVSGGHSFASLATDAGVEHTCALTAEGEAYCWGGNYSGQLGTSFLSAQEPRPVAVVGGHTFVSIVGGYDYTCGVRDDGEVFCWGANDYGQLGIGEEGGDYLEPVQVLGVLLEFTSLSAGDAQHTCGLTSGGDVYCWGTNWEGELGHLPGPGLQNFTKPVRVPLP